jgi:hypothetical protein
VRTSTRSIAPRTEQFGADESRLNRLAEPDLVREQDARSQPAKNRQRWFELVWEQIDPRVERSLQSAGRPIVGEEMSAGVAPMRRANHRGRLRQLTGSTRSNGVRKRRSTPMYGGATPVNVTSSQSS